MISSLFTFALLAVGSVSALGDPTQQVTINTHNSLTAKQAFDIYLQNLLDPNTNQIPYSGTPYYLQPDGVTHDFNRCDVNDIFAKVMPFSGGIPDTGIDNGIVIQKYCTMVANLQLSASFTSSGPYYFFTYSGTFPQPGVTPQNFEIDVNGAEKVQFSTDDLKNSPQQLNSGTTTFSVTLPAGATQIKIKLDSGLNPPPPPSTSNDGFAYVFLSPVRITGGQVVGDPQFTGFLNQQYQIHGSDNTVYNIISTENFQYNALFKFLSEGKCRQGTACFSHPGNYFGEVGLLVKDSTNGKVSKIRIISGDVETGLSMEVDGVKASVGDKVQVGGYTMTLLTQYEVTVESKEFNLILQNSDKFLNQVVSIGSSLMSKIQQYKLASKTGASTESMKMPHGLLGQTFEMKEYDNRWKYIQGDLLQYIQADGIFGTQNVYNRF